MSRLGQTSYTLEDHRRKERRTLCLVPMRFDQICTILPIKHPGNAFRLLVAFLNSMWFSNNSFDTNVLPPKNDVKMRPRLQLNSE